VRIVGMLTWLWDGVSGVRIPARIRDLGRMLMGAVVASIDILSRNFAGE
jgi:hypothetical protein